MKMKIIIFFVIDQCGKAQMVFLSIIISLNKMFKVKLFVNSFKLYF